MKLIQKQLEAAGLADVQVSPQVHVVKAKDKDGKQVVLVVDPSGSTLTFESRLGFPTDSTCASLAHANRNFHHPQAC